MGEKLQTTKKERLGMADGKKKKRPRYGKIVYSLQPWEYPTSSNEVRIIKCIYLLIK